MLVRLLLLCGCYATEIVAGLRCYAGEIVAALRFAMLVRLLLLCGLLC